MVDDMEETPVPESEPFSEPPIPQEAADPNEAPAEQIDPQEEG